MMLFFMVVMAHASPRFLLNKAAANGDYRAARKVILENPTADVDLDSALVCAAKSSQIHLMAFLVDCGAADLDRALVQAAMRNQVSACRWLISPERYVPAGALEAAQLAAAATNALEAEWLIVFIRREMRQRKNRRGRFDDLF